MTRKLTQKQENFINKYIECGNASEAYRHAYNAENMKDKTIHEASSRLLNDYNVNTRIIELRERNTDNSFATVDGLTKKLNIAYQMSIKDKQNSAAVSAAMGSAKLNGLLVDKKEVKSTINIETASKEELINALGE